MKKSILLTIIFCLIVSSAALAFYEETERAQSEDEAMSVFLQGVAEESEKMKNPVRDKAMLYFKKGEALFKAKDYKNAARFFYASVKIDPTFKEGWKNTGFCYYQMKQHKYALPLFRKVLELDPEDKDAKDFMEYYGSYIEKKEKAVQVREPIDSIWRAAVLPGFGQMYNGQHLKGVIVGASFALSTALTIYNVADQHTKYDKYLKTNENQDAAFKKAEEAATSALIFGLIAGGLYAAGIVDAGLSYNSPEARGVVFINESGTVLASAEIRW